MSQESLCPRPGCPVAAPACRVCVLDKHDVVLVLVLVAVLVRHQLHVNLHLFIVFVGAGVQRGGRQAVSLAWWRRSRKIRGNTKLATRQQPRGGHPLAPLTPVRGPVPSARATGSGRSLGHTSVHLPVSSSSLGLASTASLCSCPGAESLTLSGGRRDERADPLVALSLRGCLDLERHRSVAYIHRERRPLDDLHFLDNRQRKDQDRSGRGGGHWRGAGRSRGKRFARRGAGQGGSTRLATRRCGGGRGSREHKTVDEHPAS
mmetsp:Transcript_29106/g.67499  ORF Transcript_29106/g.67499 Transcript_29106/m.67499 type:complete len:262 (+) Transcript_29106:597-1382(+)